MKKQKQTKFIRKTFSLLVSIVTGLIILLLLLNLFTVLGRQFIRDESTSDTFHLLLGISGISISALAGGITAGYLHKKNGIKIGFVISILLLPFFFLSYLIVAAFGPYKTVKETIVAITPIFLSVVISAPLGGWLGEKLYFRVHTLAD